MEIKALKKDLSQWIKSIDDPELLKELWELKKTQERTGNLSKGQLAELEKRLLRYNSGEMEFMDWDTLKENIRKKSKNVV